MSREDCSWTSQRKHTHADNETSQTESRRHINADLETLKYSHILCNDPTNWFLSVSLWLTHVSPDSTRASDV